MSRLCFLKLFIIVLFLGLTACKQMPETPEITAQFVVDQAIEQAGGEMYTNSNITFNFRDHLYANSYKGGAYSLERSKVDSTGLIMDVVTNVGYRRMINGKLVVVPDSMATKYTNSVNSVHYFARLPYGLNDSAVKKTLIGTDTINDNVYYEVEVRFAQEGGGVDFQDVFVYWFNVADFSLDYLAYSYETDEGGVRFREAIKQRAISGISFADYVNYKPASTDVVLTDLDDMFVKGQLIEVSKIELENIKVILNQP